MNELSLNYCLVTQNLASIIEDSDYDIDRFPDVSGISGEVIFTPNIANGKAYQLVDSGGKTYTVPVSRIQAKIINGKITHENETGVYLFAAGVGSNPNKITYSVEYRNLRSGDLSFSLSPLKFEAIPGGEVDLTTATPVVGAIPAGITKGDKGDKGDPGPQGDKGDPGPQGDVSLDQLNAAKWSRGAFTTTTLPSMDDAPEGVVTVNTNARSQAWGLPGGLLGFVVTYSTALFKAQVFYGITSSGLQEHTRKYGGSGWSAWQRQDDQYDRANVYADSVLVEAKSYADTASGGAQPVRIPLNRPWGAGPGHTRAYTNRSCRIPVNLPMSSTGGLRVGFNNVEYLTETIYTTPVEVTGVFVGKGIRDATGELTGEFDGSPISLISEPLFLPADGSTVFTEWGAQDFTVDKDTIIGYGIRSDGEGVFLYNQGLGWQTENRNNAGSGVPGNATTQTLLGVSIELNTSAPRVLVIGDSRAAAAASGKPLAGSPANIAAASGWVPRNYAIGGSRMRHFSENTLIWDDIAETGADCALMILGSNDIFGGGTTLEQLKGYFLATVEKIRAAVGEVPIFTMELYPRFITPAPALVEMMEEFNAWTYGLPGGISGVIPIDNLIDPTTGAVHAKWMSDDDVHLSLAGNVRLAQNFQIT